MSANAAKLQQRRLLGVANEPGLDIAAVSREAIDANRTNAGAAESVVQRQNRFNQDESLFSLNRLIPGYGENAGKQGRLAGSLLAGELPKEVQDSIARSAATRSFAGGYGGGGAARNLGLRDLGLGTLSAMQQGSTMFSDMVRSTPRPTLETAEALIGVNGQTALQIRQNERNQKLAALLQYAGAPGATAVVGKALSDTGSSVLGGSMGKMG